MKLLKTAAMSMVLAAASTAAMADTLTFEGLSGSLNGSNYGGFSWSNFNVLNSTGSNSGYSHGTVSGVSVAFNAFANPASFSSATAFTLNNAFFTGAWNDGLSIHVVGTGTTTYVKDFVVSSLTPSNVVFNWTGLNSVSFSSLGGTPHGGYSGAGAHFAMDNLTVNVAAVPEPETFAMLLAGLGLMGAVARRRKAQKA